MNYIMPHLRQLIPEQRTEPRCLDFTLQCITLTLVKPLNSSVALFKKTQVLSSTIRHMKQKYC